MDMKRPEEINTHPTFESLFPINPQVLAKIEQDMRDGRYDRSQPIILATWEGQDEPVCIDGHTRRQAAINVGIEEVPVWIHELDTEEEAIEKALKLQRNRRNMTDAEILTCVKVLDQRGRAGRPKKELAQGCAHFSEDSPAHKGGAIPESCAVSPKGKSAKALGELLGISTRKVEQARTVLDRADPETVKEVKSSKTSINKACQKVSEKTAAAKHQPNVSQQDRAEPQDPPDGRFAKSGATENALDSPTLHNPELVEALVGLGGTVQTHVERAVEIYLILVSQEGDGWEWTCVGPDEAAAAA